MFRQMVHAECCGPTFAGDCQNCQADRFYLYYPAGHSPAEIAGPQAAVTRSTATEAYPNAFRLSPGSNFATNNRAYVAAAAVAAGHLQPSSRPLTTRPWCSCRRETRGQRRRSCCTLGQTWITSSYEWVGNRSCSSPRIPASADASVQRRKAPLVFYNPSAAASNWTPPYPYTPVCSQITHAR